jgi:hypothetical protein
MHLAALLLATHLTGGAVPLKQPQIAADGSTVALTYGSGSAVYFALSTDGGKSFGEAVKVAEAKHLALGRHRGPRIALTKNAIVISANVAEKGGGADGDLVAWRSTDNGKTWSKGKRLNDVAASAREGLHGMAANRDGVLFAAWLDLRAKTTQLYGTVSKDGGATWSPNRLVYTSPDGHICECCHPSVAVAADGTLYAMWRNWLQGSRDMYAGVSRDGGATFQASKLGEGTWPLNACPMDGGGLVLDAAGTPVTVWRRIGSVFLDAAGKPESELGKGKDAAIAIDRGGKTYIAWTQGSAVVAKLPGQATIKTLAPEGGYVSLAGAGPVYAAWESGGTVSVEKIAE